MIRLNTDVWTRRASRNIARAISSGVLAILTAYPASAQGVPQDSLLERLRRAEAAIATLQTQIAEQAGSGVQTRSRAALELNGRILVNTFHNSRGVNNVDNPQFALAPDATPGQFTRGAGIAIRQTQLGLVITVPEVMGGSFTGDLDVDFYGGQVPSGGGRTFPLIRMRTARGVVRWSNAQVLVGQESPLISGLNPVSPTAVGTPALATAGNLWLWLPQFRAGVSTSGALNFGVQGAVLAPTSGDPAFFFETDYDQAERTQRPFVQARAHVGWGQEGATVVGEIGCGVHRGWLRPQATREDSDAVACDLKQAVGPLVEIRGEIFTGKALRGLGGGGIGQNFIPDTTRSLETTGGWAQINVTPRPLLRFGAGCGGDHPERVSGLARSRNDACAGYAMVRPSPLFFAVEMRRIRTEYLAGRATSDHLSFAAGFEF